MRTRTSVVRHGPGRPPKYGRPSHAVTVTLPEDVLARLRAIDPDLGRAIVSAVERGRAGPARAREPVELATYGSHAVIVVTPVKALKRIAGIQLVPAGNGRALISLDRLRTVSQLELDVRDAIERVEADSADRATLEGLVEILREARGSRALSLQERTIIVLESKRRRPGRAAAGVRG